MTESADLDRIAADIGRAATSVRRASSSKRHLLWMPGSLVVAVASADYCGLIVHIRPKLADPQAASFDAEEGARDLLERDDDDPTEQIPQARKLASKRRSRNGETFRLSVGVMCEGVLHWFVDDADWFAEFETEAEALKEELDEARAESEQRSSARKATELWLAERRTRLAPLIKQLMADPRFSGPKVGVAKRTALAEDAFP